MHINAFDILVSKKNLSALQKPLKHILIVFVCSSIAVWTIFTYGIRDMFAVSHGFIYSPFSSRSSSSCRPQHVGSFSPLQLPSWCIIIKFPPSHLRMLLTCLQKIFNPIDKKKKETCSLNTPRILCPLCCKCCVCKLYSMSY